MTEPGGSFKHTHGNIEYPGVGFDCPVCGDTHTPEQQEFQQFMSNDIKITREKAANAGRCNAHLEYPRFYQYVNIIHVSGISIRFCDACFEKLKKML